MPMQRLPDRDTVKSAHRAVACIMGDIDLLQIAPTLADSIGIPLHGAKAASLWPTISQ